MKTVPIVLFLDGSEALNVIKQLNFAYFLIILYTSLVNKKLITKTVS